MAERKRQPPPSDDEVDNTQKKNKSNTSTPRREGKRRSGTSIKGVKHVPDTPPPVGEDEFEETQIESFESLEVETVQEKFPSAVKADNPNQPNVPPQPILAPLQPMVLPQSAYQHQNSSQFFSSPQHQGNQLMQQLPPDTQAYFTYQPVANQPSQIDGAPRLDHAQPQQQQPSAGQYPQHTTQQPPAGQYPQQGAPQPLAMQYPPQPAPQQSTMQYPQQTSRPPTPDLRTDTHNRMYSARQFLTLRNTLSLALCHDCKNSIIFEKNVLQIPICIICNYHNRAYRFDAEKKD